MVPHLSSQPISVLSLDERPPPSKKGRGEETEKCVASTPVLWHTWFFILSPPILLACSVLSHRTAHLIPRMPTENKIAQVATWEVLRASVPTLLAWMVGDFWNCGIALQFVLPPLGISVSLTPPNSSEMKLLR